MLKRAVDDRKLPYNVASLRQPPRVTRAKVEILEPGQIPILIQDYRVTTSQPIALLALATGMRRGELLALRWSEVDLDGGVITVERSVEETGTVLTIKPPKTEAGNRKITIPANTVTMLRAHRAEQMQLRLALGQGGAPVLVFSNVEGEMFFPDDFSKTWRRIVTSRKLPKVTFHALRHTDASILLAKRACRC